MKPIKLELNKEDIQKLNEDFLAQVDGASYAAEPGTGTCYQC